MYWNVRHNPNEVTAPRTGWGMHDPTIAASEHQKGTVFRMNVRNLLATQQAGFVSLHEVLTRMTQIDGASYQEAATLLHRLLRAEDEHFRPRWYECTTLYGKRLASDTQGTASWECLRQAAHSGLPLEWDDEIPF
jgi:hypothetical protein